MAWPTTRPRSGGSRRDARGRLLGVALGVGAVVVGAVLLVVGSVAPERTARLRSVALDLSAPVWEAARVPVQAARNAVAAIGDYWNAIDRARRLETELAAARRDATRAVVLAAENRRLKRLLQFTENDTRRVAVARVAGGSGASLVETAVIGAGSATGVRPGQPVVTDAGLLGRVTEVGARASRVLLVTDTESRVPVRVVRTGAPALLAGVGGGMAELRFVGSGAEGAPRVGDLLVTSGEGGLFAPDVPVARVESVRGEIARARPVARPDTLGIAVVEAAWLPPPGAAAAAASGLAAGAPAPMRMAVMVNP